MQADGVSISQLCKLTVDCLVQPFVDIILVCDLKKVFDLLKLAELVGDIKELVYLVPANPTFRVKVRNIMILMMCMKHLISVSSFLLV